MTLAVDFASLVTLPTSVEFATLAPVVDDDAISECVANVVVGPPNTVVAAANDDVNDDVGYDVGVVVTVVVVGLSVIVVGASVVVVVFVVVVNASMQQ